MPVYFRGGIGELSDTVIKLQTDVIVSRETGWMYSTKISDIPPAKAFPAVKYDRQHVIRIARTIIEGELIPGMIEPSKNEATFSFDGKVYKRENVHTLCGRKMKWTSNITDRTFNDAIEGGRKKSGRKYYIGLAEIDGRHLIGRVDEDTRKLYVPYQGSELEVDEFKLLVWGP